MDKKLDPVLAKSVKRQELRDKRLLHGRIGSKCASTSFSLRVDDLAMLDYAAQEMGLTYSEAIRRLIRVKYLQLTTE